MLRPLDLHLCLAINLTLDLLLDLAPQDLPPEPKSLDAPPEGLPNLPPDVLSLDGPRTCPYISFEAPFLRLDLPSGPTPGPTPGSALWTHPLDPPLDPPMDLDTVVPKITSFLHEPCFIGFGFHRTQPLKLKQWVSCPSPAETTAEQSPTLCVVSPTSAFVVTSQDASPRVSRDSLLDRIQRVSDSVAGGVCFLCAIV